MAESKRLAAHRANAACDPVDDDEDENVTLPSDDDDQAPELQSKKKEPQMDEAQQKAAVDAAKTEGRDLGFKEANDRMNKVFASEHYAGRETLAAKMLAKPNMTADDIIDLLADAPKAAAADALSDEDKRKAAEEGGRREMQEQLNKTNADLGTGEDDNKSKGAKADDVWAKARKANS